MMSKVVIDTNVLVSSILSKTGAPAEIMSQIVEGRLTLCYSAEILKEYERVLAYDRLGFDAEIRNTAIEDIVYIGDLVEPSISQIPLVDESDRAFYDTAKESGAYLITYNAKHYPIEPHILAPSQFLEMIKNDMCPEE